MSNESTMTVQVTHHFIASADQVFDAWLDQDRAGNWLFKTPGGEMIDVKIDGRIGGGFTIVERRGEIEAEHHGLFTKLVRPALVAFRFAAGDDVANGDPITIDITPTPLDSGCDVTLTHEMKTEWAAYADRTKAGWTSVLVQLDEELSR